MFHNFIDEEIEIQNEQENSEKQAYSKKNNRKIDFKNLFSVSDIIIYIVSLMISMVGFGKEFAPFSLSIFAATCSNRIPAGVVLVTTLIGTLIGFGVNGFLSYLITVLLFIVLMLIFRPRFENEYRNEKQKLGKYVLISSFVVQAGKMIFSTFLVYDLLTSIMLAILCYIFYKIFANSITVVKEFGKKRAFTIEEVMGASMLLSIAFYSLHPLNVFGLSISNILSIMIVLFLGWKNGILVGGTSGITIGMVMRNNWKF